jgi:hypothetical protein
MLVKLLPEQCQDHWPMIKNSLLKALPPTFKKTSDTYTSLLEGLKCGDVHAWASTQAGDVKALVVTQVMEEQHSKRKQLLIYSLAGYDSLTEEMYKEGYEALSAFAREIGCDSIVAYTDVQRLVRLVRNYGARVRYYIEMEV